MREEGSKGGLEEGRGTDAESVGHGFLLLLVGGDVENETSREVCLVEAHEHVLVPHVLQHQQLNKTPPIDRPIVHLYIDPRTHRLS